MKACLPFLIQHLITCVWKLSKVYCQKRLHQAVCFKLLKSKIHGLRTHSGNYLASAGQVINSSSDNQHRPPPALHLSGSAVWLCSVLTDLSPGPWSTVLPLGEAQLTLSLFVGMPQSFRNLGNHANKIHSEVSSSCSRNKLVTQGSRNIQKHPSSASPWHLWAYRAQVCIYHCRRNGSRGTECSICLSAINTLFLTSM